MSPAPTRAPRPQATRASGAATPGRFNARRGYLIGLGLLVFGAAMALVGGLLAAQRTTDEATDLVRNLRAGDFVAVLEQGENIIYTEDGIGLGVADVRVFDSGGEQIPGTRLTDDVSYDIDLGRGEGALVFDIPATDNYRVELNTPTPRSIAIGERVGNTVGWPAVLLLLGGFVLMFAGVVKLLITMVQHARHRARMAAAGRLGDLRERISAPADPAAPGGRTRLQDRIQSGAEQAMVRARETADAARTRMEQAAQQQSEHGRAPVWTDASELVSEKAENVMGSAEAAAASGQQTDAAVAQFTDRVDSALQRVQDRLAGDESLRDIVADERATVSEEFAADASAARALAEERMAQGRSALEAAGADAGGEAAQPLTTVRSEVERQVASLTSEAQTQAAATAAHLQTEALSSGSELTGNLDASARDSLQSVAEVARGEAQVFAQRAGASNPLTPPPAYAAPAAAAAAGGLAAGTAAGGPPPPPALRADSPFATGVRGLPAPASPPPPPAGALTTPAPSVPTPGTPPPPVPANRTPAAAAPPPAATRVPHPTSPPPVEHAPPRAESPVLPQPSVAEPAAPTPLEPAERTPTAPMPSAANPAPSAPLEPVSIATMSALSVASEPVSIASISALSVASEPVSTAVMSATSGASEPLSVAVGSGLAPRPLAATSPTGPRSSDAARDIQDLAAPVIAPPPDYARHRLSAERLASGIDAAPVPAAALRLHELGPAHTAAEPEQP